jgi:cytochrome c biogenesis protein CcdA
MLKTNTKKRTFFVVLILGLILGGSNFAFSAQSSSENTCAVYFTGVGCTHCARTDSVVLENLPREYPNLIIIEYEIYQQKENAPLLYEYSQEYDSGLGVPLIIFNKEEHIAGDRPILNKVRGVIEKGSNPCPLLGEVSESFEGLNLTTLPGLAKIWKGEKILMKKGTKGDSKLLKELLKTENLSQVLEGKEFKKIEPVQVPLSGKNIEFENAIRVGDWIFQWNGEKLVQEGGGTFPPEKEPSEEEPLQSPGAEKLTLAKILSLGAVDAVNPCALAVLSLMLIAILTYNPSKKRNILLAGLAFVFSVFVMYLIYGLIIVKSFQIIQALTSIRLLLYKILGGGAIILGFFKLRSFARNKAVCKVTPKVDKIISKITSPKGAFLVGAFVTIFLLPCTIGPYIICGGILSSLCLLKALPMLLLYNFIFVLPMIAVVLIIYFGLSRIEDISVWQAKNIKYLDLISGLVILGLGIAMILGLV